MVSQESCNLVLWTKVISALEGLRFKQVRENLVEWVDVCSLKRIDFVEEI